MFGFRKTLRKRNFVKENDFLMFSYLIQNLCCVWFSKNTKKRKKNVKKNDFLMFNCLIKTSKENKVLRNLSILKLFNLCIDLR